MSINVLFLLFFVFMLIACGGGNNSNHSSSSPPSAATSSFKSSSTENSLSSSSSSTHSAAIDRLRDYADFPIGVGIANSDLPEFNILTNLFEQTIAEKHFDQLTSINIMRGEYLHPTPNSYDFIEADAFVVYAAQHSLTVHGNALINAKTSPEFMNTWPDNDPQGFLVMLEEHVSTIVSHFSADTNVVSWDVIEGISFFDPAYPLSDPFYIKSGNSTGFVERAFNAAHLAAPNADLYVVMNETASDSGSYYTNLFISFLSDLQQKSIPIDGVSIVRKIEIAAEGTGMGNFWREYNVNKVIKWAVENGLKVRLMNVRTDVHGFIQPDQELIEQKMGYCKIVKQYLDLVPPLLRGGISMHRIHDDSQMSFSGVSAHVTASLFDKNYQDRPALNGFATVLKGEECSTFF